MGATTPASDSIRFFVAGLPKALSVGRTVRWATKDGARSGSFQQRRGSEWATLVGEIGRRHAPAALLTGPLSFSACFHLPRPTSGKKALAPVKRPDLDNLLHKLTDQWNGVFYADDSQVVELIARKVFAAERPGVEIIVEPFAVSGHA